MLPDPKSLRPPLVEDTMKRQTDAIMQQAPKKKQRTQEQPEITSHHAATSIESRQANPHRRVIQSTVSLEQLAPGVERILTNLTALLVEQPCTVPHNRQPLSEFIANTHTGYKCITRLRQMIQPVIDLLKQRSEILQEMEPEKNSEYGLVEAEEALARFNALQDTIRQMAQTSGPVEQSVISNRNQLRLKCIHLMKSALESCSTRASQNESRITRYSDALIRSKTNPVQSRSVSLSLAEVQESCAAASRKLQMTRDRLEHAQQRVESDAAVDDVRETLLEGLFQPSGTADSNTDRNMCCMGRCSAAFIWELKHLRHDHREVSEESKRMIIKALIARETALECMIQYYQQQKGLEDRHANLKEQYILMKEGLAAIDTEVILKRADKLESINRGRNSWIIQSLQALDDAEKKAVQVARAEWESEVSKNAHVSRQAVAEWLQFANRHYPEWTQYSFLSKCFAANEMECAERGLLLKEEILENYKQNVELSSKSGRKVSRRQDIEGSAVVVKKLHLANAEDRADILRRWAKVGQMRGILNVAPILGVFSDVEWGYVLLPYYPKGNLATWIQNNSQRHASLRLRMAHQLLKTVKGLHEMGLVLRDLRLKNIFLMGTDEDLQVLLDISDNVRPGNYDTIKGEQKVDRKANVKALGYILKGLFDKVGVAKINRTVSDTSLDMLIKSMTQEDAEQRPTVSDLLAMPVFGGLQSASLCGTCLQRFAATGTPMCNSGHVLCDTCLNQAWVRKDKNALAYEYGLFPCPMQTHGCDDMLDLQKCGAYVERLRE